MNNAAIYVQQNDDGSLDTQFGFSGEREDPTLRAHQLIRACVEFLERELRETVIITPKGVTRMLPTQELQRIYDQGQR